MGSLQELQTLLLFKEERIRSLQKQLDEKDEKIQELRSQLDKFQSVLSQTFQMGPRKQRAQGISAEPQMFRSIRDISSPYKKYSKTDT